MRRSGLPSALVLLSRYLVTLETDCRIAYARATYDERLQEAYSVLMALAEAKREFSANDAMALIRVRRFALETGRTSWDARIRKVTRRYLLDDRVPGCLTTSSRPIPEQRESTLSWEDAERELQAYVDEVRAELSVHLHDEAELDEWVEELTKDFIAELEVSVGLPSSLW